MLLTEYLNSQFSLAQHLELLFRIFIACLCGAGIGLERSSRYKEAGIRTHIIVCCAAALLMIVSKYGFADLSDPAGTLAGGVRGTDPARIAAQVVSGISFLGAGVIFKHGNTIRGLTTAAGLWATAGIGLTIGAGMYGLGIATAVLLGLLQTVSHWFHVGRDSLLSRRVRFTLRSKGDFQAALETFLRDWHAILAACSVSYLEDGALAYDLTIRSPRDIPLQDWERFLRAQGDLRTVICTFE